MILKDGFYDVPAGKIAMVVTHLEMTARQTRGVAAPEGVRFAELPREIGSYRDLFRRIGQPWLWFGRLAMPDAELENILQDRDVKLFTLLKEDRPEALLELDFRIAGQCELAYFGLTESLIGTGAGAYLMDRAQQLAFEAPINRFHVHTCTLDSPQALAFYIRSGFTPTRRQIEIADDPRHLNIYPALAAPQVPML